ncbi:hypothetical protein PA905_15350 [Planktothrix agardhii CCAP 1459/11A]|jgi:drug/metabolite transporter (DMT)-like permease|uniref:DUF4079 domain-containing protein n=1 Tax=Planktothrix agardhii CCAP 1459/11A TaxID=282420 RepID=A0A4P5ZUM1_PLAAG|nr:MULTISPECIES: DUF4079 domain-containing protein [Planktothrix]GDZ93695.1 hypothetical protein PA905_15350 [Planktothrix agardhii CCAP 1459/11A]CAD5927449.1 hypothetical protein NO108_01446 [Planktothrix rubescens]CAH2572364.1 hypothetical protein PRNO82_01767 [Planktothrix rubescens]
MEFKDIIGLIHPVLAVVFVFPLIGISVHKAWQTRQRRLHRSEPDNKTKIPANVGQEHLKIGRWLTGSVVGITLVALAYSISFKGVFKDLSPDKMPQAIFIVFMFVFTIASLILLYRAKPNQRIWRGVFATLTGMGIVVIGCQEGVFRRGYEWQVSHYYYGVAAALLMVFALAIVPEIYQSNRWRITHTVLNCIALLLFLGQGMTGTRDLLEIPLSWQQQHLYQCDWNQRTCPQPPKG